MNTIKSKLLFSACSCALVLASANAWASSNDTSFATPMPVVQEPQVPPTQAQPDQSMPTEDAKSAVFTGTVMKSGEQYVLRDSSGRVFRLDDSSRAQSFEGKTVKVTGRLDANAKMIHVDTIQELAS